MIIKQNHKYGVIVAFITAMIFGLHPSASRAAYADGANIPFVLLLTTFIRTIFLSGVCYGTGNKLLADKGHRRWSALAGLFQALAMFGIIGGVSYLPGPLIIISLYTCPLFLLLFLVFKGEERFTMIALAAIVLVLSGASMVLEVWNITSGSNAIGLAFAVLGIGATVGRMYIYGQQVKIRNPMVVGAEAMGIAFLLLISLVFWQIPIPPQTVEGWGWVLASSMSLSLGSIGMLYGIALCGTFRWSILNKMEVIFTALFAVLLLGEGLSLIQYAGMAIVIGSLVTYQLISHKYSEV